MAHRRMVSRGARRSTTWFFQAATQTTFTAAGGTILTSMNAAALAKRPFTIERTHLMVHITSDQLAADELQWGALGLAVVSDQAVAIGVTAVPTPATDAGSEFWFLHQFIAAEFSFVSGSGFDANGGKTYLLDSKAKRKVGVGEDIIMVGELVSGLSNGFILSVAGRMLIKEH